MDLGDIWLMDPENVDVRDLEAYFEEGREWFYRSEPRKPRKTIRVSPTRNCHGDGYRCRAKATLDTQESVDRTQEDERVVAVYRCEHGHRSERRNIPRYVSIGVWRDWLFDEIEHSLHRSFYWQASKKWEGRTSTHPECCSCGGEMRHCKIFAHPKHQLARIEWYCDPCRNFVETYPFISTLDIKKVHHQFYAVPGCGRGN